MSAIELRSDLKALAGEILAGGRIEAADVERLREEACRDGVRDRATADLLFHLNDASSGNDEIWERFFVTALTDYFLNSGVERMAVGEDEVAYLETRILHDGRVDSWTEFELLSRILTRARHTPARMKALALQALRDNVLKGGGVLFGAKRRRAGIVDDGDLDVIRHVLHGTGSDAGRHVGLAEADMLIDLDHATAGRKNAAEWQGVFVEALTTHLMERGGLSDDAAEWLAGRLSEPGQPTDNARALLAELGSRTGGLPPALAQLAG